MIDRLAAVGKTDFKSVFYGWDDTFYYLWLQTPVVEGELDFRPGLNRTHSLSDEVKEKAFNDLTFEDGKIWNKYPIGWALMHAPGFLLAHASVSIGNIFGANWDVSGFGRIHQLFVTMNGYLYSVLGCLFVYLWLKKYLNRYYSIIALFYVLLSGSVFYYLFRQVSMAHHLVFFLVAAILYFSDQFDEKQSDHRIPMILGFLSGLLLLVRPQACIYLIYPLVVFLKNIRSPYFVKAVCLGCSIGIPVAALQLFIYKIYFGSFFTYSYGEEGFNWLKPNLWEVLFSPLNGAFYWHPVLLVGLLSCIWLAGAARDHSYPKWSPLFMFALVLWLNAAWWCWWYGASFGNRSFEGVHIFCALWIGLALRKVDTSKFLLGSYSLRALLLILCVWNGLLILGPRYWKVTGICKEQSVTYSEMLNGIGTLLGVN